MCQQPFYCLRIVVAVTGVLLWLGLAACGETIEPIGAGEMTVSWELKETDCRGAGVESVAVQLTPVDDGVDGEARGGQRHSETVECAAGEATVEGLEGANYDLELLGRDHVGDVVFAAGPRRVTVYPERQNVVGTMELLARPSQLQVEWRFQNGRVCGTNGVERLRIDVMNEAGESVAGSSVACSSGGAVLEEVPPGLFRVALEANSGDGATYRAATEAAFRSAKRTEVSLVLAPEASSDQRD